MMPKEPVRDMMRRTMENLRFVERHSSASGPFELTQLLNSFLGALAHPWEDLVGDLERISIEDAAAAGWPSIDRQLASDAPPRSLGDLLRHIRNGLAHGNIRYWDHNGKIAAVEIVSKYRDSNTGEFIRAWGAVVTVEHMRQFLECFVHLAERLYENRPPRG